MPRGTNDPRPGNSQQTMNRAQRRQQAQQAESRAAQQAGVDRSEVVVQQNRNQTETRLTEEGEREVMRRELNEEIERQFGGIPVGPAGQQAAKVIAEEQDVDQRLVINEALERSGRGELSPRSDDPIEIVRALEPGAVRAAIDEFGRDSAQTSPFRNRFGSGETLTDQVAQARETVDRRENLLQQRPEFFAESVDFQSEAQAIASIEQQQQRSRSEFRAERDARTEAANAAEEQTGVDFDSSDIEIEDGEARLSEDAVGEVRTQQRAELRSRAAEDFGVDASSVEISQRDGELVAQADIEQSFEQQFRGDPARGLVGADPERAFARRTAADELGVDVQNVELTERNGQVFAEADVPRSTVDTSDLASLTGGSLGFRNAPPTTRSTRSTLSTDTPTSSPGLAARGIGTVATGLANNPVGRAIGTGADVVFGIDSPGGGVAGDVSDFLDTEAEGFNRAIAEPLRTSDPARTEAVAPGVGGTSAAANSEFIRNSAATATEFLNPAALLRDSVDITRAGANVADFVADEGPQGAQAVSDAAAAGVRAAPGVAVDLAETAQDNPQQAAEVGTALAVSSVAGGGLFRGARGAASTARQLTRRLDADLSDFRSANRAQAQIGGQRSPDTARETVDFENVQSGRDFEADLRQQELSQDQAMLRDQAAREQAAARDLVDDPRSVDPVGTSGRGQTFDPTRAPRAGPSRPTARTQNVGQQVPREITGLQRADNVPTADLRTTVDVTPTAASATPEAMAGAIAATGATATRAGGQLVDAEGNVIEPATGADIGTPRPLTDTDTLTPSRTATGVMSRTDTATATGTATASAEAFLNDALSSVPGSRGGTAPTGVGTGARPGARTGLRTGQRVGSSTDTALRQRPASATRPASRARSATASRATSTSAGERIARAIAGTGGTSGRGRRGLPEFSAGGEFGEDEIGPEVLEETFDNPIASVEEVERELNEFFERS